MVAICGASVPARLCQLSIIAFTSIEKVVLSSHTVVPQHVSRFFSIACALIQLTEIHLPRLDLRCLLPGLDYMIPSTSRLIASSVFLLALSLGVAAEAPSSDAPPIEDGMTSIFGGEDLSGWSGDPRLWSVKDGAIYGETTKENAAKGNTFLIWDGVVKDFELRLSFRCNAINNSGIQYRSKHIKGKSARNEWVVRGYQHELRNEEDFPNVPGFIYDEGGSRGRICLAGQKAVWNADGKEVIHGDLIDAAGFKALMKVDQWNDVVIIAKGKNIKHYLNGKLILDFTDNHPEKALSEGVLALQLHAGKPMWANFKNIRIKDLAQ